MFAEKADGARKGQEPWKFHSIEIQRTGVERLPGDGRKTDKKKTTWTFPEIPKKENEEISEQIAKREKREMSETNEIEPFPRGKDLIPFKKSLILAQDERWRRA